MIKAMLFILGLCTIFFSYSYGAETRTGKEIYTQYCSSCHAFGPGTIKGNKAAWRTTLKLILKIKSVGNVDSKSTGLLSNRKALIDALVKITKEGVVKKGMPVKGTCINCTDAELQAAIAYMLPENLDKP